MAEAQANPAEAQANPVEAQVNPVEAQTNPVEVQANPQKEQKKEKKKQKKKEKSKVKIERPREDRPHKIQMSPHEIASIRYIDDRGLEAQCAETIIQMFDDAARRNPDHKALCYEKDYRAVFTGGPNPPKSKIRQKWNYYSYSEYFDEVNNIARSNIAMGMNPRDAIMIWSDSSPMSNICILGAIFAGGIAVCVNPFDSLKVIAYKIKHCGAVTLFVDSMEKQKILQELYEKGELNYPDGSCCLKSICVLYGEVPKNTDTDKHIPVYSWYGYRHKRFQTSFQEYFSKRDLQHPGSVCMYVYTKSNAGFPKAAMITHDNICWNARCIINEHVERFLSEDFKGANQERVLSYGPHHMIETCFLDIFVPIALTAEYIPYKKAWGTVYFARNYDYKENHLWDRMKVVEPTIFAAVPKTWRKLAEQMHEKNVGESFILSKCRSICTQSHKKNQSDGKKESVTFYQWSGHQLRHRIHKKAGLYRLKMAFAQGILDEETQEFFASLNINVLHCNGFAETTACNISNKHNKYMWMCAGKPIDGQEVELLDDKEEPVHTTEYFDKLDKVPPAFVGEICVRSRATMMGFLANPALGEDHMNRVQRESEKMFLANGFLRTRETAVKNKEGYIKMIGRKDDFVLLDNGLIIGIVPMENAIRKLCPAISNIIVIGDRKKYCTALVTIKTKGANGQRPGTNRLLAEVNDLVGEVFEVPCDRMEHIMVRLHKDQYKSKWVVTHISPELEAEFKIKKGYRVEFWNKLGINSQNWQQAKTSIMMAIQSKDPNFILGFRRPTRTSKSLKRSLEKWSPVTFLIWKTIEAVNNNKSFCPHVACQIKRFTILRSDFCIPNGQLSAEYTLERTFIHRLYGEKIIKKMYDVEETEKQLYVSTIECPDPCDEKLEPWKLRKFKDPGLPDLEQSKVNEIWDEVSHPDFVLNPYLVQAKVETGAGVLELSDSDEDSMVLDLDMSENLEADILFSDSD